MRLAHAPIALTLVVVLLAPVAHAQTAPAVVPLEGGARAIVGTVEDRSETTLTIAAVNGERITVDVSALDEAFRQSLLPGQKVRVLATHADSRLVAQGLIVHHDDVPPAALPRP